MITTVSDSEIEAECPRAKYQRLLKGAPIYKKPSILSNDHVTTFNDGASLCSPLVNSPSRLDS